MSRSSLEPRWGVRLDGLATWLSQHAASPRLPLRASRIGLGQSNLILLVEDADARRWIARRPPLGTLLESAHDLHREWTILSALSGTDVPCPDVVGYIDDRSVCDAPVLVMEYVDGIVIDDMDKAHALEPGSRHHLGMQLVETLARLHEISPEAAGLAALASTRPYADRQLYRWSRQWAATRPSGHHAMDELTPRLESAAPTTHERRLVHGDMHLKNVIVTADGDVLAALDWELSTLGDPIADLGTLLAYWPQPGDEPTLIFPAPTLTGFPARRELVAAYEDRTGRDLAALPFWHALALWKLAIIAQGVLERVRAEPRNRADGSPADQSDVDAIVNRALAVADEAGI